MTSPVQPAPGIDAARRRFVGASSAAVLAGAGIAAGADTIAFSQVGAASQAPERMPELTPRDRRVGFAVVGLGRLSVGHILPAFARSANARCTALVSGDRPKALTLARDYGVNDDAVFGYDDFERLRHRKDVDVIYIVLPNSQHAEFTLRAAQIGKHVLCEKPMANSVVDCLRMIDACADARVQLMIAYRSQYEPCSKALVAMVRDGKIGTPLQLVTSNSQDMGDPQHWRLKRALAGGGPLPDVGIYCINAARFLVGQEPHRVIASLQRPSDDPRFREVESAVQFVLQFPSGFSATCSTSYATHKSQFLRLEGSDAWAEMDPAYAYRGIRLRTSRFDGNVETEMHPQIEEADQFAAELDHMADCVRSGRPPHTPGAEGLQDQRIVEAIYESAATGKPAAIQQPAAPTRPAPGSSSSGQHGA